MATPVMIKKFNLIGTTATDSTVVTGTYVVTSITVVNISDHQNQFSVFRTPASEITAGGGVFQNDCRVYKQQTIGAGAYITFSVKWVLGNGDAIGVQKHTALVDRDLVFYIDGVFVD